MSYCMYLRKSRVDIEAEMHGEGDTLLRHKKALLAAAERMGLPVSKIYEEIRSGETIAARPVMQQLLTEVEQGLWSGVFVMEVERLARGDTIDQGIVAQAFKYSKTKIITPAKVYDPNNEFDEEYFEFGLFMSRREYKTINRRLQRGRIASVQEGKYAGSLPPYGYIKKKLAHEKGFTLEPHPEQAAVVRLIFRLYTEGEQNENGEMERMGMSKIAKRLNDLHLCPQKNDHWTLPSIRDMISNPVYIGKIRWNWRKEVKHSVNGEIVKKRPKASESEWIISDGRHPALIQEEMWQQAQKYMRESQRSPLPNNRPLKNPLSGLIVCGKCGRQLVRRPAGKRSPGSDILMCPDPHCDNVSAPLRLVEGCILEALSRLLKNYKLKWDREDFPPTPKKDTELEQKAVRQIEEEELTINKQRNALCDLVEQQVYSTELFLERSKALDEKKRQLEREKLELQKKIEAKTRAAPAAQFEVPKIDRVLQGYGSLPDAKAKNDLLKEVLVGAKYYKTENGRWHGSPDGFTILLYPRFR